MFMMIVGWPLVTAGHNEHRAVLFRAFIQIDAYCQYVVVCVRVEGPILMPLYRFSDLSGLHIYLGIVHTNARRHQGREQVHDERLANEVGEEIRMLMMRFDPPDPRFFWCVRRIEVEYFCPGGDLVGLGAHPFGFLDDCL